MPDIISSVEMSFQIVKKHGLFYAQAFDTDTMNLVFEIECVTRQGAAECLANFLQETLLNGLVKEI